ncbi:MAG: MBL fold metallo-hydrolase [Myxococcota bacterium]
MPTTGKDFARCGGNTSCIEVRVGENLVVFDAGSGIRELGNKLLSEMPIKMHLFFTHYHWDHIMGFPFFLPLFIPGNEFVIYGEKKGDFSVKRVLEGQMSFPYFPVKLKDVVKAKVIFKTVRAGQKIVLGDTVVRTIRLKHPMACLGYSIERNDSKLVHLTDIEHNSRFDASLINFCKGADALIYDAAYTPEEYETKKGWGHSTWHEACKLASEAGVKLLYIFHHDPSHSDAFMENVLKEAKKHFKKTELARDHLEKWL